MTHHVERTVEMEAPLSRVWRALTDHVEFGTWFRVELDEPFAVGARARGRTTFPGYEGMAWEVTVQAMEHERVFAFTWCPYPHEEGRDESAAPTTLVEFRLEATATGTRVTITESGFDRLPADERRAEALRSNADGWETQLGSLARHVQA